MRYRRPAVAGGTYFFTVNLADRSSRLLVEHVDDLRTAVRIVKRRHPFEIIAWVVLPEHMHAIWTLPAGDHDFSGRWSLIKSGFSRAVARKDVVSASREGRRERGIWQRRFWEHWIRDEHDLQRHVDYVHINPVKHGHVKRAADWPRSSIHRHIKAGWLTADWACDVDGGDIGGKRD
ncbi:MAG: REP-associated tyrosine transposase [Rhodanobacteraceae bacterium]